MSFSGLVVACAGGSRPRPVTPAEVPTLTAQAAQQPRNAQIRFRLAAALLAAGQCDSAIVVANAGEMLAPAEALGPMVVGGCQEKDGRYDLAFATYTDFANKYPQARGVAAVRDRATLSPLLEFRHELTGPAERMELLGYLLRGGADLRYRLSDRATGVIQAQLALGRLHDPGASVSIVGPRLGALIEVAR